MAAEVPLGSEGLIFHPNLQGGSTEPRLRGNFVGITFRHTRAYFARSVLEGVAFSLLGALEREESLGVRADNFRLIGGGSRSSLWQRVICDVFGREMIVPAIDDSSFGTAMLGGIAIGVFKDIRDAVNRCVQYKQKLTPDEGNYKTYQVLFERYKEIEEVLVPIYRKLHEIRLPVG
jgi:xylulokinase